MPAKVAVIGSYNRDLLMQLHQMPVVGETLLGKNYQEGHGGKGSNQAVAAARQGAEVHFFGCIGQDRYGDEALALWEQEGIHIRVRRDQNNATGVAMILVLDNGDNMIAVGPGANQSLGPEDITMMEESIAEAKVLLLQLEIPVETALHAIKLAKKYKCKVILNPAPVQPLPKEIYQHIDLLTPNETEARVLVGEKPDSRISTEHLCEKLLTLGVKRLVMTQGRLGALYTSGTRIERVPSPKVRALDPTGSGDAFNGTLAVMVAQGAPIPVAVQRACYAGAFCATKLGVLDGLATADQLDQLMDKQPL